MIYTTRQPQVFGGKLCYISNDNIDITTIIYNQFYHDLDRYKYTDKNIISYIHAR